MRRIRTAEYEELQAVSDLMSRVFKGPMQEDYSVEARETFLHEISLSSLQKRFFDTSVFYLACDDAEIEGVLELEQPSHIAFLFALKQGQGIGKALCEKVFERTMQGFVTVGAFPKAAGFYEGLGFKKVSDENSSSHLPFVLMARHIDTADV
jgi:GNAT superfamily N-acetyltransferase